MPGKRRARTGREERRSKKTVERIILEPVERSTKSALIMERCDYSDLSGSRGAGALRGNKARRAEGKRRDNYIQIIREFDPGSGRTLAACLTHASRAEMSEGATLSVS